MIVTDTIADLLTRIRNANQMRYKEVSVPASKLKEELARILKEEGFIADYKLEDKVTEISAKESIENCKKILDQINLVTSL